MNNKFWIKFDNMTHSVGRIVRHGNGNIRVMIAIAIIIAASIYPFMNY